MREKITVIGSGVIGLTSALRLAEQGWDVTVWAQDELGQASPAAGAYWWPHKAYPQERVSAWSAESLSVYEEDYLLTDSGVWRHRHDRLCVVPDDASYCLALLRDVERIPSSEWPMPLVDAFRVRIPMIDVPVYLPRLRTRAEREGVRFLRREVTSWNGLDQGIYVNATGLGARGLGDNLVRPYRGQMLRVVCPSGLEHSIRVVEAGSKFTLILPRGPHCLLGGTAQVDDWELTPDPQTSAAILARCASIVPALRTAEVLDTVVALRPARDPIRLEAEALEGGVTLIHNYGHGGGGFTVCWGCAAEVVRIAEGYR